MAQNTLFIRGCGNRYFYFIFLFLHFHEVQCFKQRENPADFLIWLWNLGCILPLAKGTRVKYKDCVNSSSDFKFDWWLAKPNTFLLCTFISGYIVCVIFTATFFVASCYPLEREPKVVIFKFHFQFSIAEENFSYDFHKWLFIDTCKNTLFIKGCGNHFLFIFLFFLFYIFMRSSVSSRGKTRRTSLFDCEIWAVSCCWQRARV